MNKDLKTLIKALPEGFTIEPRGRAGNLFYLIAPNGDRLSLSGSGAVGRDMKRIQSWIRRHG